MCVISLRRKLNELFATVLNRRRRRVGTSATTPLVSARTAVVIASAGRPALLEEVLRSCARQQDVEFDILVSVPDASSLPDVPEVLDRVRIITGSRGAAAQRNAALDVLEEVDVVAFFDDDSVLRPDYLSEALRFLRDHQQIVGLTGRVLIDGAVSGEIPRTVADQVLAASATEVKSGAWRPTRELYGCNFVFRFDQAAVMRFDPRLPLYSWLEDHDFARRLMRIGPLAEVDDCVIVHRAAASGGRQAHTRFGYSQVMNAVYLQRKGTFPRWLAVQQISRPVLKNIVLSLAGPQSWWRRERLRGNSLAARDALRGRITPERITDL